jgi:predicted nucleotidyltransferase
MRFGLDEATLELLLGFFAGEADLERVYIFGSRAMGCHRPGSDVDLAIVSSSANDRSAHVRQALDDLATPYLFDVVDLLRIGNPALKAHIEEHGRLLYQR